MLGVEETGSRAEKGCMLSCRGTDECGACEGKHARVPRQGGMRCREKVIARVRKPSRNSDAVGQEDAGKRRCCNAEPMPCLSQHSPGFWNSCVAILHEFAKTCTEAANSPCILLRERRG